MTKLSKLRNSCVNSFIYSADQETNLII